MKLLLDQGMPRSACELLRARGFDVVHAAEIGLATAFDSAILERAERAERDGAVVVTLDADFHALLAVRKSTAPSVLRLRVQGLDGPAAAAVVVQAVRACEDALNAGAAATVDETRVRVRRLPLV